MLERQLGAGGMATVYLARDLKHDREVALKVLRPELAAALGADRFLQEVRISARLDHPHILTLIDSGQTEGFVWYVLPYVRGESLRERLTREKQLPVDDVVRIASQVASALDYAHRQGVVHRDIKPENILLHEGEAVVTDFGIALALQEAGGDRITESGLSLGTPQYMSPEQATGGRELDARSDVYSLGAVTYEMLAGEPPHTGPTAQAIIAKLVTERPTRIRTVRDTMPASIDTVVGKALAKVPADRFRGAAEFASALESAATGTKTSSRSRRAVALACAVGALLLAAVSAVWHPWRRRATDAAPAAPDVASVAVLPFDNLTGNPSDRYLSDGMTEEIIGQLVRARDLKVISRTSAEALKGTHLSLRQIADTLGVRHILEGSVRHVGNRIRVSVDLIEAASDIHVWAASYDRDLTDVFAVQEEIARHIADSLGSMVGSRPPLGRHSRTENPEAYAAYLSGRSLSYRRTLEGLQEARTQFDHAITEDSTYAPAYAGLAAVYFHWVFYNYPGVDFNESYGRALALARRAVALDSNLAEAYAGRGYVLTRIWAPTDSVAADFKRALELSPNSADVHQWYSQLLSRESRYDEALQEAERAVALDPLAPGVRLALALLSLGARRYEVVEQEAVRVLALEPTLFRARQLQALGYLLAGNPRRCASLELGPYSYVRALCLHSLGRTREAAHIADSLRVSYTAAGAGDSTARPALAARGLAEYNAWTGNAEESVAWLERAYAASPAGEEFQVIASGLYDKVRDEPRFRVGLQRAHVGIHQRVEHASVSAPMR